MQITRRLEFDAGHRIPNHRGQCRHVHGHRYALEVTLAGNLITSAGASEEGMVMDYSEIKNIAFKAVVEPWDHAFLTCAQDAALVAFLRTLPNHKTVVLEAVPTVENLALTAFRVLDQAYQDIYGNKLRLERLRIYETPNNWADAVRADIQPG